MLPPLCVRVVQSRCPPLAARLWPPRWRCRGDPRGPALPPPRAGAAAGGARAVLGAPSRDFPAAAARRGRSPQARAVRGAALSVLQPAAVVTFPPSPPRAPRGAGAPRPPPALPALPRCSEAARPGGRRGRQGMPRPRSAAAAPRPPARPAEAGAAAALPQGSLAPPAPGSRGAVTLRGA